MHWATSSHSGRSPKACIARGGPTNNRRSGLWPRLSQVKYGWLGLGLHVNRSFTGRVVAIPPQRAHENKVDPLAWIWCPSKIHSGIDIPPWGGGGKEGGKEGCVTRKRVRWRLRCLVSVASSASASASCRTRTGLIGPRLGLEFDLRRLTGELLHELPSKGRFEPRSLMSNRKGSVEEF